MDEAVYSVHSYYYNFEQRGENELSFVEFTNKQRAIDDVEIKLFDEAGKTD